MNEFAEIKESNKKLLNSQIINGEHEITAFPYQMFIDPSNICNLKCPFCANFLKRHNYSNEKTNPIMPFQTFVKLIDEIGPYLIQVVFGDKSEPLLNKEIYKMIAYAKKYGIHCQMSTNFNLFRKEHAEELMNSGLDSIIVGLEGTTQESYSRYRVGGDFNRVIENIKIVVETKKRMRRYIPSIQWAYVVFQHNENEIKAAEKMSKKLGVNGFRWIPGDIYDFKINYKNWLPKNEKYTKYRVYKSGKDVRIVHLDGPSCVQTDIKNLKVPCITPFVTVSVDANGDIFPCINGDLRESRGFGNISEMSFKEIWNNRHYKEMRQFLITGKNLTGNPIYCERCYTAKKTDIVFTE
ncbi:MAG: radical SAM protein [Endomicrobiales bacterium]|nr:radical SAM protein [Endomicrobiales bacterium]